MDETIWHKCRSPLFHRRTVDGGKTSHNGQTWRRWRNGRWEYRQDEETEEELLDRQW
jgi:hypothetical protein